MRRLLFAAVAVLGTALPFLAHAQNKVYSSPSQTAPVTVGTFTLDTSTGWVYVSNPINVAALRTGALEIQINGTLQADSTKLDSIAADVFVFTDPAWVGSSGSAADLVQTDDSNGRANGFFITTMDSLDLVKPQNLTPWSAAFSASTKWPKFPYDVSSRVYQMDADRTTDQGDAIPGMALIQYAPLIRTVSIPMSGPFGDALLCARTVQFKLVWRHPRITGLGITMKWTGSSY